jgi:predicted O-linked N-acetylglucosamine transferase (SPINDLY family)
MRKKPSKDTVRALIDQQQSEAAYADAVALLAEHPADHVLLQLAAEAALQSSRFVEAQELAARISNLAPQLFESVLISAAALRCSGDLAGAEHLLTSIHTRYKFSPAIEGKRLQQLGLTYLELGRNPEALKTLARAQSLRSTDVQLLSELGHVHDRMGKVEDARTIFLRAHKLSPTHFLALRNAASAQVNVGRAEEALVLANAGMKIDSKNPELASIQLLAATCAPSVDGAALRDMHVAYAKQFEIVAPPLGSAPFTGKPVSGEGGVLNIAYFSHHFRQFPLLSFVPHVMRAHDRSRFRVFALSVAGALDSRSREYVDAADEFHDLSTANDEEVVARIRAMGIDILIDLSGYTLNNRFSILRRRPAPIQVSWLGYLVTTGSAAIDYHITDAKANPPGMTESLFTEKLIRLPVTQSAYRASVSTAAPMPCAETVVPGVTFGVFSAPTKLNAEAIATFARVLQNVPASRIQFLARSRDLRSYVLDIFKRHGVKSSRVEFFARQSLPDYFIALSKVDVVLDSFPFVGGTVVCDALWMGTPVISMWLPRGFGGASRSVLETVGLGDLVAYDVESYVGIATTLGHNGPRLRELRVTLRDRIRESALGDSEKLTASLEQAYLAIWRRAKQGLPAQHLNVDQSV